MTQFSLANLRFILDTEDKADAPNAEELLQQLRENLEVLFMLLLDTGDSGSATSDPPNDTTGVLTDTGASYDVDEHNGRTLVITSGTAKNTIYTIDDTTATTIVCTGDNLYAAGVRSGDTYKVFYDLKVNTDGHNNDGVNSAALQSASISQALLKTSTHEQTTTQNTFQAKTLTYADYGFNCRLKATNGFTASFARSSQAAGSGTAGTTYIGETVYLKSNTSGFTAYLIYRYISASGEVFWLWLLRDKLTKEIIDADASSDHCSFGLDNPSDREHPFLTYDPAQHEIVLINPTKEELKIIYETSSERGLLQTFLEDFEIDDASVRPWPTIPVTTRIKNNDWMEALITKKPVEVEKKIIPKVDYVLCKSLKSKVKKL